jgi:hypothetical protein
VLDLGMRICLEYDFESFGSVTTMLRCLTDKTGVAPTPHVRQFRFAGLRAKAAQPSLVDVA